MKAYSVDVREKVLQAVDQGYPREQIIKLPSVQSDDQALPEAATGNRKHRTQSDSGTPTQKGRTAPSRTDGAVASP